MSQHSQFGHHHHHPRAHPAVLHNASLAEIASQPASSLHYGSNLGSAVASSMHLTNSTSETDAGNTTYKMEHDMMYYSVWAICFFSIYRRVIIFYFVFFNAQQTNPSDLNHTNDGFLNSILNDEDLQLMDMAVNEGKFFISEISSFDVREVNSSKLRNLISDRKSDGDYAVYVALLSYRLSEICCYHNRQCVSFH